MAIKTYSLHVFYFMNKTKVKTDVQGVQRVLLTSENSYYVVK